jgi:hypothetical protein
MVDGGWESFEDGERSGLVGAGGEDIVTGCRHASEDLGSLGRRFSGGVDDLGEAGAEGAVVVDPRVAQVFKGKSGEAIGGLSRGEVSAFDGGQEFEKSSFVHDAYISRFGGVKGRDCGLLDEFDGDIVLCGGGAAVLEFGSGVEYLP